MFCSLHFTWQPCNYSIDRLYAMLHFHDGYVNTIIQRWHIGTWCKAPRSDIESAQRPNRAALRTTNFSIITATKGQRDVLFTAIQNSILIPSIGDYIKMPALSENKATTSLNTLNPSILSFYWLPKLSGGVHG